MLSPVKIASQKLHSGSEPEGYGAVIDRINAPIGLKAPGGDPEKRGMRAFDQIVEDLSTIRIPGWVYPRPD